MENQAIEDNGFHPGRPNGTLPRELGCNMIVPKEMEIS
jgi:hypothetical protein